MIKSINGWRAVFALSIVLFHVGVPALEEMTWAGVSFFFMASGLLLALKHPVERLDKVGYRRFSWNHLAKLFPLHWLTLVMWLAAMAIIGKLVIDPLSLGLNVTLLHSWSLTHSIYFSYNKFSWFLSTLLVCYLCYPLLARWYSPLRLRHQVIILAVLAIVDFIILAGTDDYGRTALYVFPLVRIIDFMIGMTLANAINGVKRVPVIGKSENGIDAELIAIAALSAMILTYRSYEFLLPWSDAILWWIPVALILLSCVLYDKREGYIGRFLSTRPMQWLGNISFEIFMLQGIAALVYIYWVDPVLGHLGITRMANIVSNDIFGVDANLMAVFVIPIDILLAWIVNRIFTRPIHRLIKS